MATRTLLPGRNANAFSRSRHTGRDVRDGAPRGCGYHSPRRRRDRDADGEIDRRRPSSTRIGSFRARDAPRSLRRRRAITRVRSAPWPHVPRLPVRSVILPGPTARAGGGADRFVHGEAAYDRDGASDARQCRCAPRCDDAMRGDVAPVSRLRAPCIPLIERSRCELLQCREGSRRAHPSSPARAHHTNLRNSGRWLDAMGGSADNSHRHGSVGVVRRSGFELTSAASTSGAPQWGYSFGS